MITVRHEQPGDEAAIHAVHAASFPTAGEADLVDALRAARRLLVSPVAVSGDRVIGHVAFSPVRLTGFADDATIAAGAGLAPVAVHADVRGRGVAEALVRAGLDACERAGIGFVVVLGEPEYYARFGFRPARRWGVRDEYGGGNAFQVLNLRPRAMARCGGVVRYAPGVRGARLTGQRS